MPNERLCRYCLKELPPLHVGRGRQRQFCNDTCRVMKGYRNRNGVTTNRQRLLKHLGREYRPRVMSEPEKAWLAAMIDGEGCILLVQNCRRGTTRRYVFPSISVANTNAKLIERVREVVGHLDTRVQTRDRSQLRNKTIQHVFVNRIAMADVLEAIKPYLIAKVRQAELVIEFCREHDTMPCKTAPLDRWFEMHAECASLNKRGL